MWRAFFLAVGSTLILLGVQTLVVDHIVVANGTRVPGFVAKFLDRGAVNSGGRLVAPAINANPSLPQQVARVPQVSLQGIGNQGIGNRGIAGTSNPTASRFGPSRFSNTPFSNTNLPGNIDYYGGVPFSNRQSPNSSSAQPFSVGPNGSNSQFSLAGYGGQGVGNSAASTARGVGQANRFSPVTLGRGGSRLFKPAEWMPWGFLAIGTLVVLYTNSIGRGLASE